MAAAAEELTHARLLADALYAAGVACSEGAAPGFPVGRTATELISNALDTEALAVRLYGEGAAACAACESTRALFARIGAEERDHMEQLQQRLRARGG